MIKNIFVFCFFINFVANAQSKEEILKHHFHKMGNPERWLSVNSIKVEGFRITNESDTITQLKYAKKPNLSKIEIKNNITKPVLILVCADSLGVWQKVNNNDVERISKYGIDFIQVDMTIFIASELKNKDNIQLKPNETVNSQEYYVLDIKNSTAIRRLLYINTKTYMIDAYRSIDYESGSGILDAPTTFLSDYRDVKGFLFPFQAELREYETKTITTNIQINIPLDNKIFSPEGK